MKWFSVRTDSDNQSCLANVHCYQGTKVEHRGFAGLKSGLQSIMCWHRSLYIFVNFSPICKKIKRKKEWEANNNNKTEVCCEEIMI